MAQIKISQLPAFTKINANTQNTIFVGVDIPTDTTFQMTAHTLAQGLYSSEILNVGNNIVSLPNTIAQFSLAGESYIQTNLVNLNDGGTADFVVTANTGTDSTYFIDLGFANKNVQPGIEFNNLGTAIYPLDGYLYVQGGAINAPGGPGGNLTIGTTTSNTEIKFIGGGHDASNVVAKITGDGLFMVNGHPITFTDGTKQNTAAAPYNYANAAFAFANTAVQNTALIQLQSLALTGNLTANSIGQNISVDSFLSNNATFNNNLTINGSLTANTLRGNVFFSNVTTNYVESNIIKFFTQTTPPQQISGQLWYTNDINTLTLDTDIAGDRPGIGRTIYERVYNGSGATIAANSWVRLSGSVTMNAIPYIALADATNAANSLVLGIVKNAIPNGAYGYSYSVGVLDGVNTSGFANGDIIFLSAASGAATNVAPVSNTLATITLGKVLYANTVGKLQIDIKALVAYGKANGQVIIANNGLQIASVIVNINELAASMNINGFMNITTNSSIGASNTVLLNLSAANGVSQPIEANGYVIHATGQDGYISRIVNDAAGTGAYALYLGRTARGTAMSPTAVQNGDSLLRLVGNGYGTTGYNVAGGAKIQFDTIENFTDTNKGTIISFWPTPAGTNVITQVMNVASNVINIGANTALNVSNIIQYNANTNNSTATQLANKSNTVTCNGRTGQITTSNAQLNKGTAVTFTVNNSYVVSAKDVIILNIASGASVGYSVTVNNVTPGSFNVCLDNCDGTPSGSNAADALVINFAIIRVA